MEGNEVRTGMKGGRHLLHLLPLLWGLTVWSHLPKARVAWETGVPRARTTVRRYEDGVAPPPGRARGAPSRIRTCDTHERMYEYVQAVQISDTSYRLLRLVTRHYTEL